MQSRSIGMRLVHIAEVSANHQYAQSLETVKKITQIDNVKELIKRYPRLHLLGHLMAIFEIPIVQLANYPFIVSQLIFSLKVPVLKSIDLEIPIKPPKLIA